MHTNSSVTVNIIMPDERASWSRQRSGVHFAGNWLLQEKEYLAQTHQEMF